MADEKNAKLLEHLTERLGDHLEASRITVGHAEVRLAAAAAAEFFQTMREAPEFDFDLLVSITAVDFMDDREDRFDVVYHLLSLKHLHRLRIKIALSEAKPEIASLVSIWKTANFLEREVWDMYGITFTDHPDLRRVLMYDEFEGFPLRKDYPLQAKQPRIKLRHPEVRNTALDMNRPALVNINPRSKQDREASGA